ncbi:MAG: PadR family transcriptional regulator [Gammaproteobacteria bacterium]|nr:PadR family transcriptional regulator [Gammaproteobacteria bacterium]MDH4255276.1 PadR family transcriptional regulator [Gammaproteobacteria bacterium]MDH5310007.1 PadR family transcriptional regulator [Gammaproteobacteria bacterium]
MDVKTVCLGMLTQGDASGYDLKKYFESSFGHFFAAGYGSIYPALAALADQGLVSCEEVPQERKPDRKVYSITDQGRAELQAALVDPNPSHKVRSEFLAMMFFAHLLDENHIDTVLNNRVAECDRLLQSIKAFEEQAGGCDCLPSGARFVAGFGKAIASACRHYIEENRKVLVEREARDAGPKVAAG